MESTRIPNIMEAKMRDQNDLIEKMPGLITQASLAEAEYDKAIAITIAKLEMGEELELNGTKVKAKVAAGIEKKAKGLCYKELADKIQAKEILKLRFKELDKLQAQLNASQSLLRNQQEMGGVR